MTIHVHEAEILSLGQIQAFLGASETIRFEGETQTQIYHWIEQVLGRQEYQATGGTGGTNQFPLYPSTGDSGR
ncbi:MAG TPA: hypothetical protein VIH78_12090 [Terriglobales bacterium]